MVRNLALDMKPLRVNLVVPGAVDTELWDGMTSEKKQEMFDGIEARVPTGKVGQAEDVAESFLYAMRDANLTGVVLKTDSGSTIV